MRRRRVTWAASERAESIQDLVMTALSDIDSVAVIGFKAHYESAAYRLESVLSQIRRAWPARRSKIHRMLVGAVRLSPTLIGGTLGSSIKQHAHQRGAAGKIRRLLE